MIQCRDGTQDQRNINAILELAAGAVDVDAASSKKSVSEEEEVGNAKEGEGGGEPSAKRRRREVKNAVRGSGQYVYDEEGVRLVFCFHFSYNTAHTEWSSEHLRRKLNNGQFGLIVIT